LICYLLWSMDWKGMHEFNNRGWDMKRQNWLWKKLIVVTGLATLGSVLAITTSFADTSANCRAYADDYSVRYSAGSIWDDVFRVRGRPSGTAMAADRSRRLQRSTLFNKAYAHCMSDRWP
jgi:hypothetical protein